MNATKILSFLSMYPDSANYFGISENLDLVFMFGVGELTGQQPAGQYVWFWGEDNVPTNIPDFVYNTGESKVYGYFID
jgi:hypothetical protein